MALKLYVYNATPARLKAVRAAKAQMDLDVLFTVEDAVPGCGKCLAWDTKPPFICEYGLLTDSTTSENMAAAIYSYIGVDISPRWKTYAGWLSAVMGGTVVELEPIKEELRVRFE